MDQEKSIHEGHRDRLRQRYREVGLDHFKDYEVLELLLGYTIQQKDTNATAHNLIEHFSSLRDVLEADEERLIKFGQVGPGTAFFLSLLRDVARRYAVEVKEKPTRLIEPHQCEEFFIPYFLGRKTECIYAAFLDRTKLLLDCIRLGEGAVNAVHLNTELLRKEAKKRGCRYVVLAHNHFTDPTPSLEDIVATRRARTVLEPDNISVSDHIIVCGGLANSMLQSGHFAKTEPFPEDRARSPFMR